MKFRSPTVCLLNSLRTLGDHTKQKKSAQSSTWFHVQRQEIYREAPRLPVLSLSGYARISAVS